MQLNLGQKIRDLRRRDGCTQEALAQALGVTSQAVSRWEANGGYPDMEMIPSIAHYFGISIDELFGYDNERTERMDALAREIDRMNAQNNGVDLNMNACIAFAREALIEFPGNERIMLSLASALYNAGYVRHGEHHLTDDQGYDVLDAERHRTYGEWKEAIALYEKLLKTAEAGEIRYRAIRELIQLYLNTGAQEKALELIETAPDLYGSKEFLRTKATDGRKRAEACGEALLKTVRACSELMVSSVLAYGKAMPVADKVQSLRDAAGIFRLVCTDGNCGMHHAHIARVCTLLSLYLWLGGKKDEAFSALDEAREQFNRYRMYLQGGDALCTAPLVRLVGNGACRTAEKQAEHPETVASVSLAEDWPWWCVPEAESVRAHMQADPRWEQWVSRLQQ